MTYADCPRSTSPEAPRLERFYDVNLWFHAFGIAPAVLPRAEDAVWASLNSRISPFYARLLAAAIAAHLRAHDADADQKPDHYFVQVQPPRAAASGPFEVRIIPVPPGVHIRANRMRSPVPQPYAYDRPTAPE